ncbi:MAG: hypothetical protein IAE65_08160 [Ignavibacteria bacterium]|nr:hypothetical protein [Ignavibacteria bacterium]
MNIVQNENEINGIEYDTISRTYWKVYDNNISNINDFWVSTPSRVFSVGKVFTAGKIPTLFYNDVVRTLDHKYTNETYSIHGVNEYTIVFGSSIIGTDGNEQGYFYVWNGMYLMGYEINDLGTGKVIDIFVENMQTKTWLNTENGNSVYQFSDKLIKKYSIDSGYKAGFVFKNEYQELILVKMQESGNKNKYKIYKFNPNNDKFEEFYNLSCFCKLEKFGQRLMKYEYNKHSVFENGSWREIVSTLILHNNNDIKELNKISGNLNGRKYLYSTLFPFHFLYGSGRKWGFDNTLNEYVKSEGFAYKPNLDFTIGTMYFTYNTATNSKIIIGKFK